MSHLNKTLFFFELAGFEGIINILVLDNFDEEQLMRRYLLCLQLFCEHVLTASARGAASLTVEAAYVWGQLDPTSCPHPPVWKRVLWKEKIFLKSGVVPD